MMMIVLSVIVIACFVVGVSFLYRGYASLPSTEKMASRDDLQKSDQDLQSARSEAEKLRLQLDSVVIQFEETKGKLSWSEKNVASLETLRSQGAQVQTRLEELEKDLRFLSQKADSQAREAIDVITQLSGEKENLQRSLEQPAPAGVVNSEEFNRLTDENQKFKIQGEGYANKVKELEAKVNSLAPSSASASEEELKKVRQQNEERIVQANASLVKLNSEIEALNAQIAEKDNRIKKLNDELLLQSPPADSKEKVDLQKRLQYLLDKEKVLTYKLSQSRAQAMGLEKICEEFKYQAEQH